MNTTLLSCDLSAIHEDIQRNQAGLTFLVVSLGLYISYNFIHNIHFWYRGKDSVNIVNIKKVVKQALQEQQDHPVLA